MSDPRELQQRLDTFRGRLKKVGLKLTHQRYVIFRELVISEDHPDVDTIFQNVRRKTPSISLDTVYRTLWLLRDLGMIETLGPSQDRTRFDGNMAQHHHFICTRCGKIRDFYSSEYDNLEIPGAIQHYGTPDAIQVEIKGICNDCRKPTKSRINTS